MKIKDIINKTPSDLNKLVAERREALRVFRFGAAGSKTKNVKEGKTIRKEIAQILTILGQKKEIK